jgi:hypothetical protein
MQNLVQQGFMYPDAPVVFNKAKIAKVIHEETESGPCCVDHFRKGQHTAGSTGVVKKDHIAYMILLMLREIGFILNRGNCRMARDAN